MKKIFSILLLITLFFNLFWVSISKAYDENDEKSVQKIQTENFFVVTAYYSPVPGQKYYLRWNYEDEVILNGRWIAWASWKEVFPWMLAAPKTYKFWTKIYLEWVWVWEVSDRWWAIVSAWNRWYSYDRIDIWMWVWEEWLKRALAWWKRVVPGYVMEDSNTPVSVNLSKFPSPDSAVKWLTNNWTHKYNNDVFSLYVTPESGSAKVIRLQQLMYELDLINKNQITWKYDDSKNELINYQFQNWIIPYKTHDEAGYFWPKTRKKMSEDLDWLSEQKEIERKLELIKNHATKKVDYLMKYLWNIKNWDKNNRVKILQQILIIFKSSNSLKATWIYWDKTELALKRYQLARWVIQSFDEVWAWNFWPKTKAQLRADLIMLYEKKLIKYYNLGGN